MTTICAGCPVRVWAESPYQDQSHPILWSLVLLDGGGRLLSTSPSSLLEDYHEGYAETQSWVEFVISENVDHFTQIVVIANMSGCADTARIAVFNPSLSLLPWWDIPRKDVRTRLLCGGDAIQSAIEAAGSLARAYTTECHNCRGDNSIRNALLHAIFTCALRCHCDSIFLSSFSSFLAEMTMAGHENYLGNWCQPGAMDMHNNRIGSQVPLAAPKKFHCDCGPRIQEELVKGNLRWYRCLNYVQDKCATDDNITGNVAEATLCYPRQLFTPYVCPTSCATLTPTPTGTP